MNYLLDTHTFLWMVSEPEKLSKRSGNIIKNKKSVLYFSAASAWEITIKQKIGKLTIKTSLDKFFKNEIAFYGLKILPIELNHIFILSKLPDYHKDPFDRILISQSLLEKYPLITDDSLIKKYRIKTIW